MIGACLQALLSQWRRTPFQLFTLLAGLAIATALWSGVQAINAEARASYDAAATTLGEGQYDQLVPTQGAAIPQADYVRLRLNGWLVSPVIEGRLGDVRLVGIDPLTSPTRFGASPAGGRSFAPGGASNLFANAETATALNGVAQVTVDPGVPPGVALGDIGVVQDLLQRDDLTRLIVLPDQPMSQPALGDVAPSLRLQAATQTADISQLTNSFHMNLTAFGLLSFAVGLFIVQGTIGLAFEQRREMIRTLRSLGVPLRTLIVLIVLEMLTLAVFGAGLGIVLGYVIAAFLLPDVAATLKGLYGAQVSGTLQLRAEWWLSGLLIAMLGTGAALAGPLWQIWRMPILASARPRAWLMAGASRFRGLTIGACALLSVAALLVLFGQGLVAGFALLACLLIGAAFALPVVFEYVLSFIERRARTPVSAWFCADTRQQLPALSLALMALLLAVSANIGVSTMVFSFRQTFVDFLDQRLAPELFVQVNDAGQSAALDRLLTDRGFEVLPLYSADAQVAGQPVEMFGIRVGPTYRTEWAFLGAEANAWDKLQTGVAVVVNEQLARRANLWVGDRVDVAPDLALPIAAVVGDYGNPKGQVIVSEQVFQRLYPDSFASRFGIRTQDIPQLRQDITRDLGIPDSAMIDQSAIKAVSIQVFERTFAVTTALNILTLGVAGFAILMSLLTLADRRVPQLAPVWALGLTRRTLGQLELLRAFVLACIVFVCAMPLGLGLAWVLLSIVNVEAFGWKLPMFLFPAQYMKLGGYAVIAVLLAAAWPALRLMRTPPSVLLKVFANEH